jgi:NAD(P)-dependent dehydrogenase (short-subunit alcohol dehydrogenase family)
MIDLTKWEQIASEQIHNRKNVSGRLGGKIAIVTGSAQGFGKGIAEELYREGASVVIADLNEPLAKTVAASLGERAVAVKVDVSNEESVASMIAACVESFGGLDLFVSNAGVLKAGSLDEMEKQDFEFVTAINYTAFFTCVKYAQRIFRAQFQADPNWMGDIIEINSKSGLEGSNKNFAYAGGKFGGIGLVESFALELAPYNIKVNAICPGNYYDGPLWSDPERGLFVQYLRANKVPGAKTIDDVKNFYLSKSLIKRGCLPSDVAKAIFYAVEQTFETGQAIPVTGGQVMLR